MISSKVMAEVNKSGDVYLTPGKFNGNAGIRAAFSNWMTTLSDVAVVTNALDKAYTVVAATY